MTRVTNDLRLQRRAPAVTARFAAHFRGLRTAVSASPAAVTRQAQAALLAASKARTDDYFRGATFYIAMVPVVIPAEGGSEWWLLRRICGLAQLVPRRT